MKFWNTGTKARSQKLAESKEIEHTQGPGIRMTPDLNGRPEAGGQ